jgi:hypothetical protein
MPRAGRLLCFALAGLGAVWPLSGEPDKKNPPRPWPTGVPTPVALPITQALLLNGRPFPKVERFVSKLPAPKRALFVSASGPAGDGSENHPWNDLQAALCALAPGDRLHVQKGAYGGVFSIGGACHDGTEEAPIQVFFEKATLKPSGTAPGLTVEKSFWHLDGLTLDLEAHGGPGVSIAKVHDVTLDRGLISGGSGPGIRVAQGAARVTIANSRIQKLQVAQPGPDSVAIEIVPRTREIKVVSCRLSYNPAGSVRVDAGAGEPEATDLSFEGNSIHDDGGPGLAFLGGERVRITGNTIFYGAQMRAKGRGIVLEGARGVVIEGNHIADASVAIRVGFADPKRGPFVAARDVSIARNDIENALPQGVAIDIESGSNVRVTNNVIERYADAIMVFGSSPQTQSVSVANNLVLAVSDVAFVLAEPKAAAYFDHNIFSPLGDKVDVQVGKKTLDLARFLKGGKMPQTKLVKGVVLRHRDLAAVDGVATVDQGKVLDGLSYKGSAPDIGVAEK